MPNDDPQPGEVYLYTLDNTKFIVLDAGSSRQRGMFITMWLKFQPGKYFRYHTIPIKSMQDHPDLYRYLGELDGEMFNEALDILKEV